jgi:hypothetical protein
MAETVRALANSFVRQYAEFDSSRKQNPAFRCGNWAIAERTWVSGLVKTAAASGKICRFWRFSRHQTADDL